MEANGAITSPAYGLMSLVGVGLGVVLVRVRLSQTEARVKVVEVG